MLCTSQVALKAGAGVAAPGARRGGLRGRCAVRAVAASEEKAAPSTPPPTLEYQREKAKEVTKFFRQQQANALINDEPGFGWTNANEILNGRFVMFGMLVGLITEYATGVDFPNQLKLTVSVLGIADVYD